jgi:hypothetical protein
MMQPSLRRIRAGAGDFRLRCGHAASAEGLQLVLAVQMPGNGRSGIEFERVASARWGRWWPPGPFGLNSNCQARAKGLLERHRRNSARGRPPARFAFEPTLATRKVLQRVLRPVERDL